MKQKAADSRLKLRIAHIKDYVQPHDVDLDEGELSAILGAADGDYRATGEGAEARLELYRRGDNVFVEGGIRAQVATHCRRCLRDLTEDVEVHIKWTFLPAEKYQDAAREDSEVELTGNDLDVSFYEGEEIDLAEVVREALLLELNPYPTCPDECESERSVTREGEAAELDPRWLPLLDLKRRQRS